MNGIYEKLAALVCESINDDCVGFCNLTSPTNCFQCHCIAKHLVENGVTLSMPAADVEVVKHGRWEDGKCTVCDFDIRGLTDGESDLEQWVWGEGLPHCPNCGCKMDLGG